MALTLNGTAGSIGGLVAGGLPDSSITTSEIAASNVTQAKLATGVAGSGPAFRAYQSSVQALTANVYSKMQLQSETFDTANCFDSTTNYRFTPNVAGYYHVFASFQAGITGVCNTAIYKNGSQITAGTYIPVSSVNPISTSSDLVYMNGTTDYLEVYIMQGVTGNTSTSFSITSYFTGFLARAA